MDTSSSVSGEAGRRSSQDWQQLLAQVIDVNRDVQDALDVAAVVESFGWTDGRAEEDFGYPTLFELAEELYQDIRVAVRHDPLPPGAAVPPVLAFRQVLRDYGHGLTFTLPMLVAVAAMITLHISLSSYQFFSLPDATALGLATFLSFVTTGGFSQAMANVYYILLGLQETELIERTVLLLMRWGVLTSIGVALGLWLLDTVFPLMPPSLMAFMGLYLILMATLWMTFAGLYVLRREYLLAVITGLSSLLAYGLWTRGVPVVWAQTFALGVASLTALIVSGKIFRRTIRKREGITSRVIRTRTSELAYATAPYFIYGILYFVFIYADRLVAWSTNTVFLPYNLWFRGQYELGMDWSLISLLMPLSAAEVLIGYLFRWMQRREHETLQTNMESFRTALLRTYWRAMAIYVLLGGAGALGTWAAVQAFRHVPLLALAVPVHGVEPFVFDWSAGSYVLLAVSLFNVLLLFTFAYPAPALRAIVVAIGVDLLAGLLATKIFGGYQFAVWGLTAGVIYLTITTTRSVITLLPKADYLLYRLT